MLDDAMKARADRMRAWLVPDDTPEKAAERERRRTERRNALPQALAICGVPRRLIENVMRYAPTFAHPATQNLDALLTEARACGLGQSAYLWSTRNGTGKSHFAAVACAMRLRRQASESGERECVAMLPEFDPVGYAHGVMWTEWPLVLGRLRDEARDGGDTEERMRGVSFLVLDDVDAVKNVSAFALDALDRIVSERNNSIATTIFTANCPPTSLVAKLGDGPIPKRIVDRIHEIIGGSDKHIQLDHGSSWRG